MSHKRLVELCDDLGESLISARPTKEELRRMELGLMEPLDSALSPNRFESPPPPENFPCHSQSPDPETPLWWKNEPKNLIDQWVSPLSDPDFDCCDFSHSKKPVSI